MQKYVKPVFSKHILKTLRQVQTFRQLLIRQICTIVNSSNFFDVKISLRTVLYKRSLLDCVWFLDSLAIVNAVEFVLDIWYTFHIHDYIYSFGPAVAIKVVPIYIMPDTIVTWLYYFFVFCQLWKVNLRIHS